MSVFSEFHCTLTKCILTCVKFVEVIVGDWIIVIKLLDEKEEIIKIMFPLFDNWHHYVDQFFQSIFVTQVSNY